MSALDWLIDARFLSGMGLGFLITTYGMLTLLGNSNNPANTIPKLKLSSKKLPSISELKQAYQKHVNKPKVQQKQPKNQSEQKELNNSDGKVKLAKNKHVDDEEEVIRKKVKMQYHQFDPLFEENRSQKSFSNFESIGSSPKSDDKEGNDNDNQFPPQNQQNEPDLEEIINFAETSSKVNNENGRKKVNVELFPHKQIQQSLLDDEIIE